MDNRRECRGLIGTHRESGWCPWAVLWRNWIKVGLWNYAKNGPSSRWGILLAKRGCSSEEANKRAEENEVDEEGTCFVSKARTMLFAKNGSSIENEMLSPHSLLLHLQRKGDNCVCFINRIITRRGRSGDKNFETSLYSSDFRVRPIPIKIIYMYSSSLPHHPTCRWSLFLSPLPSLYFYFLIILLRRVY